MLGLHLSRALVAANSPIVNHQLIFGSDYWPEIILRKELTAAGAGGAPDRTFGLLPSL
jgi:hypothetical protein